MNTRNDSFSFSLMLLLIIGVFFSACSKQAANTTEVNRKPTATLTKNMVDQDLDFHTNFPYDLDNPTDKITLPNKLKEISGLGIDATGQYLYAVQDEEGDLFIIDRKTGKVEEQIKFHKEGDYEGIEFIKDRAYIVKSTGTIYEIHDIGKPTQKRTKHKFDFSKSSDVEGLGYDPIENTLLVSCKGKALRGEEAKLKKGIYSIDLETMTMDTLPRYTVTLEAVKQFLETHQSLEYFDKLVKVFKPEKEFIFGPSGIAVHPKSGEIYITSAIGNVLVVLSRNNQIIHLQKLRKKIHEQPEGIVFDDNGHLFISNEGKSGKGKIFSFAYQPNRKQE